MENGTDVLDDIKEVFKAAKVWDPIIRLPSKHITQSDCGTYHVTVSSKDVEKESTCIVDIINVMRMSSDDIDSLQSDLQKHYQYPERTIYRFDGMRGIQDKDKVRKLLYEAGREHGNKLCSRSSRHEKHSLT